ncbi:hypothetical protein [Reyranella soli]|uniref:hypothetical protein n=1 Tax=Reyranella soli TaxID=1230389 RepID=UPI0011BE0A7F|nr:hypothetical protein [Reyranella soli]
MGVGLEAPELQCRRARALGGLDQQAAGARADEVRMGVEHANLLPLLGQERDDACFSFGDRDGTFLQDHVLDEPAILFFGVEHGQEAEQPIGGREHPGDRRSVFGPRRAG